MPSQRTARLRIKSALERLRNQGGKVNVYVGVDFGSTSYEALTSLLLNTDSLYVVHTEKGQTFHAKIYQLLGQRKGMVVVGSHNLTAGGLWTNFESSVIVPLEMSSADDMQILNSLDNYINNLNSLDNSFMRMNSQDDIDKLLDNGYVFKEVAEQLIHSKTVAKNKNWEQLFGNGVEAKIPNIGKPKKEKPAMAPDIPIESLSISSFTRLFKAIGAGAMAALTSPFSPMEPFNKAFSEVMSGADVKPDLDNIAAAGTQMSGGESDSTEEKGQTIWLETRKLTGGSRNILDLSMKSLIEHGNPRGTKFDLDDSKFMRGGVEFLGLTQLRPINLKT